MHLPKRLKERSGHPFRRLIRKYTMASLRKAVLLLALPMAAAWAPSAGVSLGLRSPASGLASARPSSLRKATVLPLQMQKAKNAAEALKALKEKQQSQAR